MLASSRLFVLPALSLALAFNVTVAATPVPVRTLTKLTFPAKQQFVRGGSAHDRPAIYPKHSVTCEKVNTAPTLHAARWHCRVRSSLYSALFNIHHARVRAADEALFVEPDALILAYDLDFTVLSVFLLGFAGTAVCLGCFATAMYLAVARVMSAHMHIVGESRARRGGKRLCVEDDLGKTQPLQVVEAWEESEARPILPAAAGVAAMSRPPGYGSFGRKLNIIGDFSGSFSSALGDLSPFPSPPSSLEWSEEEREEDVLGRQVSEHRERETQLQTELYLG